MADLQEITERVRGAVGADSGLGKTVKLDLRGEGVVFIDGGTVTNEDKPADLTITMGLDDLRALAKGEMDPMQAVMTGAMTLSNMGLAMGLQGKIQALFNRMSA
jgi:putative sterol carrier protein